MWLRDTAEEYFGLFPIPPGCTPGLKMLTEQFKTTTDANSVSREVTQAEVDKFYRCFAARKVSGITPIRVHSEAWSTAAGHRRCYEAEEDDE